MSCPSDVASHFLHPSRYLVYQYIDINIMSILFREDRNGNGTEKGNDDHPLATQSSCGLSFSCCRRLEAGWGSCNGSDVRKDRVRAMVPYPDRLARSDSRDWVFIPRYTLYAAATLAVVMASAIGFHLTILGGNPLPPIILLLLTSLIALLSTNNSRLEVQST